MRFLDVLDAVAARPDAISLAAGDPLRIEPIPTWIRTALEETAADPPALGRYEDYDGLPALLDRLSETWPLAGHDARMVTLGAQSALSLLQLSANQDDAAGVYPLGFEFSGAGNQVHRRTAGSLGLVPVGPPTGCVALADVAPPALPDGVRDGDVVFLSVPNNPTGASWSREDLQALAAASDAIGATTVFDATYALPGAPIGAGFEPPSGQRVCTVRSFSKTGLAGERVGVLDGPVDLIERLRGLQRTSYIQVARLGQSIATRLVKQLASYPKVGDVVAECYRERWKCAVEVLIDVLNCPVTVVRWAGGPFLFISCDEIGWDDGDSLFHHLLANGVAVAPGSAISFGPEPTCHAVLRIGIGAIGPGFDDPAETASLLADGIRRVALGINTFR